MHIYIYIYIYIYVYIYIYIYIYIYQIYLLSIMSSHSLWSSTYLLSPSKLAFHYCPAWEIVSRIKPVTSGDFLYCYFICSISIKESRYPININSSNIVNWYRNRSPKAASCYVLLFEHGRRLNSSVSNHDNNRTFARNAATILVVSISLAIWAWRNRDSPINTRIPTLSIDSGIHQRRRHHRTSRCLDTAGDWIRQYQIMLSNRKICRIAAYGTHCTKCSEPSNINDLLITKQRQ